MEDVIIVGAGPCGIATALACQRQGLNPLLIEKGSIVNTIYSYPLSMTFFSSADKIEIGEIPFNSINDRPTREEALIYYRTVLARAGLRVRTYEKVVQIARQANEFNLTTESRHGLHTYTAQHVVIATGYYDQPHLMGIPGEELPHVLHYFYDAHPYIGKHVVVIGARHSAIHAALELQKAGAMVTMVYRGAQLDQSIKPWIRPLIETAIAKRRIEMLWTSQVVAITPQQVTVRGQTGEQRQIPADAVFAMTGYRPDFRFFTALGAQMDVEREVPLYSEAMETTVPGLYLAGVVATGKDPTKIFIENGRYHGPEIAAHIAGKIAKAEA